MEHLAELKAGDHIMVRDGAGVELPKRAIGPVTAGGSFAVVWACREEEWQAAQSAAREPEGIPWPAEDVQLLAPA